METSKDPFVGAQGVQRSWRYPLKQYRPVSTRPWVLFLFLAATGICFGLLVAVSLIDRKTHLNIERDGNGNNERRGLSHREAASTSTIAYTTPSSSAILSLTSQTTIATSLTATTEVLSLTSQSASSAASSTAKTTTVLATTEILSLTSQTISVESPKVASATSSLTSQETITSPFLPSQTFTSTELLSLTSQSVGAILSLTSQSGADADSTTSVASQQLSLTSQSAAHAETPKDTSSATSQQLSLTSQSAADADTPKYTSSATSQQLSLTSQSAADTDTPKYTSSATSQQLSLTSQSAADTDTPKYTTSATSQQLSLTSQSAADADTPKYTSSATSQQLSLTSQSAADTDTPKYTSSATSQQLSLTSQSAADTDTPKYTSSATSQQLSLTTSVGAGALIAQTSSKSGDGAVIVPGTTVVGTTVSGTTIQGTTIPGITILGTQVSGTTIPGTTILGTTIPGTTIIPTVIAGTTVTGATLARTTIALATISGSVISEVIALGTTIPGTTISGTTILGTTRSGTTVAGAIVLGTTVSDVTILGTTIQGTTILGTTFDLVSNPSTAADSLTATTTASASTKTPAPINSAHSTSSSNHNDSVDPLINEELVLLNISFQNYDYFLAMYLPKIIAVMMASLWSIIFAGLKLMEPFYQLSAHLGAFAEETMFGNYLSSELNLSSLSAMLHGQWVLILGGVALLAWTAVVALTSEVMTVISTGTCTGTDGSKFRCDPGWAVSLPILKGLLVVVGLIFVLTIILTWIIARRKRSGVYVDPSSIAAMAELLGNPDVMQDLREIDPLASDREVSSLLAGRRYKLGWYTTGKEIGLTTNDRSVPRWGLMKIAGDPAAPRTFAKKGRIRYGAVPNPSIRDNHGAKVNRNRRILQLILDAVTFMTALAIFAIVLGYYFDSKSDPLNDFFNRNNFGPRFVLTGLALILSARWRTISQELTLMTPYRNMARAFQNGAGAPARRSILAATACTPFTAFHKGLVLRNYLIAAVALSAILSDVLLIAVSGVPFNAGQIKPSLQASTFTSLGILFLMAVTSIAVMVHNRTSAGGTRRLPRTPNTLVGVWLYLCGSGLAQQNRGNGDEQSSVHLDQAGMNAKYDGGNYGFARAVGVDGVTRWTVDEAAELHSAKPEVVQQELLR